MTSKSKRNQFNPIQAGVFWNHIGWGAHCFCFLFLRCLWSNYNQTWYDSTLGQNLSKSVENLLTSSLGGKYDVIKPFLVSFLVKIRVPLSFVQGHSRVKTCRGGTMCPPPPSLNRVKLQNPDKSVRMGWNINKLAEVGAKGGNFVCNHLVKVGKATYTDVSKGKAYNMVKLLLTNVIGQGKLVALDGGFPTLSLLRDAKDNWNKSIIATQADLPAKHSMFKSRCKKFCRGLSETLHNEDLTVIYWDDNNSVVFLDNDLESGPENWDFIETQDKRNRIKVYAPKVALLYRSKCGWVDQSNQACSYYSTEYRTRWKQNTALDSITEMYASNNIHASWINSPNLSGGSNPRALSIAEYRFEVIRAWYAIFRQLNGKPSVLHYNMQLPKKRRRLENVLSSPRKGSNSQVKLTDVDTQTKDGRLTCRVCGRKTSFKCNKCSSVVEPISWCSKAINDRVFGENFHAHRTYDV